MLVDAHLAPHVVPAVGPGRDLQAEVLVPHAVVVAHLALLLEAEDVVQIRAEQRNEAVPGLRRRTAKRLFHDGQNTSSRYRFAVSMSRTPSAASSFGSRPYMVPSCRSERPRTSGEHDGIISMPSSFIARPNCVGFDLSTVPPAFGVCQ